MFSGSVSVIGCQSKVGNAFFFGTCDDSRLGGRVGSVTIMTSIWEAQIDFHSYITYLEKCANE